MRGERIQYSLLFSQQELVRHARLLAIDYPKPHRSRYIQAAEELRSPFWDWGSDGRVPPATVSDTVRINVSKE